MQEAGSITVVTETRGSKIVEPLSEWFAARFEESRLYPHLNDSGSRPAMTSTGRAIKHWGRSRGCSFRYGLPVTPGAQEVRHDAPYDHCPRQLSKRGPTSQPSQGAHVLEHASRLIGDDSLFEDDVGIQGRLAGRDNCVCVAGTLVESKAVDAMQREWPMFVLFDQLPKFAPDRRLESVFVDGLHHNGGGVHKCVEGEQLQRGIENCGQAEPVGPDDSGGVRVCREVAVGDDQLVTVAHPHEDRKKLG